MPEPLIVISARGVSKRFVIRSESRDGGRTWSKGENSEFPNPNSAVDFIKLKNGHLLLVYNNTNVDDRMPLTAAISTDNDKSYPHRRNILNKPGESAAYPVAVQTRDGKIHVVYTSENRTVVNHAGLAQLIQRALRGPGESRADNRILWELTGRPGLFNGPALRKEIAGEVAELAALAEEPGEFGVLLNGQPVSSV